MAEWDWYQASVFDASPETIASELVRGFDLSDLRPARGQNGYEQAAQVVRGDEVLASLFWGGNDGVNVKGTGERSAVVKSVLDNWEHFPTRVDAREDWSEDGLFDRLSRCLLDFAVQSNIAVNQQGDWERGKARTLYLGSPSSVGRLVLYEKGYEVGGGAPLNWVRLEARCRPKKNARLSVSKWLPAETFGCTAWMARALVSIGWDHLSPKSVGTVWRAADSSRARRALLKQYGSTLVDWAEELGGFVELGYQIEMELTNVSESRACNSTGVSSHSDGEGLRGRPVFDLVSA